MSNNKPATPQSPAPSPRPKAPQTRRTRRKPREMRPYLRASCLGSLGALGMAACCVMPMGLILLGLGGSWLAVFGKIAAFSFPVLGASTVLLIAAGAMAVRRNALARLKWWLTGNAVVTALAWAVALNESRINDVLIRLM